MRGGPARFLQLLHPGLGWAAACSATTAAVGSAGRAFCLPPYWPAEYLFRCRPGGMGAALLRLPLDALVTALLLLVPALIPAALVQMLVVGLRRAGKPGTGRAVGAVVGAALWVWLARAVEPSHLDFILGGYAIAAGALAGAAVVAWRRREAPGLPSPRE